MADDTARAARPRTMWALGRIVRHARCRMARAIGRCSRHRRRLAHACSPRRVPNARTRTHDGRGATYLVRRIRSHLSRARSAGPGVDQRITGLPTPYASRLSAYGSAHQPDRTRSRRALPQPTVHRWLNLLETSYLLVRFSAYAENRTKRLIKAPKIYWGDTGIAMHLAEAGSRPEHTWKI